MPPAPTIEAEQQSGQGLSKTTKFALAGIAAFFGLAIGAGAISIVTSGPNPTAVNQNPPTELAADFESAADDLDGLDGSYCQDPRAISDAPASSSTGAHPFVVFTKADAFDHQLDTGALNEMLTAEWRRAGVSEPAYAICLEGAAGEGSQTCRGYGQGAVHQLFAKDYSFTMYELTTGAIVSEGQVDSASMECPGATFTGASTTQAVDARHLAMQVIDISLPGGTTGLHYENDLGNSDPAWCSSPTTVDYAGVAADVPGVWFLGSDWDFEKTIYYARTPADVTHVACAVLTTNGELEACEFEGGPSLFIAHGTYDVTVIEIATGAIVGSEQFTGAVGCPGVAIGDPPILPRNPRLAASAYEFVEASMGIAPTPEDPETEDTDG